MVAIAARWISGAVVIIGIGLFTWLYVWPPQILRTGSNYTAKIVCSNVFVAGRDPETVLAEDVQAPGNPLLRLMRVEVDRSEGTVRAGLFGLLGDGLAVYRQGTGCAAVPDGDIASAKMHMTTAGNDQVDGQKLIVSEDLALSALLDDPAITGPGMRAVVVLRNGRIIGERYGHDSHADQPLLGWSMTKTLTAALIGTLVRESRLSVKDAGLLPQWEDDTRAEITIANLLAMESGLAFNEEYGTVTDVTRMFYLAPDMVSVPANQPLVAQPGKEFSYSSGSSILLSWLWQNSFDNPQAALVWPEQALFGPLGMSSAVLETDAAGTFVGASNLYASARDWVRFGQLLLHDGVWHGERILPEGWVTWMREPTEASDGEYGRGLWLHGPRVNEPEEKDPDIGYDIPADAFWMLGHDGQSLAVIPSRNLVILRMGLTPSKHGYKPQALVEAVIKVIDQAA
ncbi:serine hydrolase domain-containing protein [Paracoccus onubensis]|uniref:Class C beta-lactamase-related serine hydrolase n=1 Tax=Paracoccus onubensis TaxID=1675788 RepID=A0A418SNA9_9RHOB|nr:serine hydrolase [Paracoccus onubensis]RJE82377.1 class C beta-lactamase-related serine hydrolase [Paracoccus onubensis]